jgi:hypothetical protein
VPRFPTLEQIVETAWAWQCDPRYGSALQAA